MRQPRFGWGYVVVWASTRYVADLNVHYNSEGGYKRKNSKLFVISLLFLGITSYKERNP